MKMSVKGKKQARANCDLVPRVGAHVNGRSGKCGILNACEKQEGVRELWMKVGAQIRDVSVEEKWLR